MRVKSHKMNVSTVYGITIFFDTFISILENNTPLSLNKNLEQFVVSLSDV